MPYFHCNDLVVLKRHRVRSSTTDAPTIYENSFQQASPTRTGSKTRRATLVGIPPTLINASKENLQKSLTVQPTVFFYNEETFQEACYRSIEDIPLVTENECLWIDVTGVSITTTHKEIPCFSNDCRFMTMNYCLVSVTDSISIR